MFRGLRLTSMRHLRSGSLVAVVMALSACGSVPTTNVASTTSITPTDISKGIIGTWRPVEIAGFAPPADAESKGYADAIVTFRANGTWRGSDGCNGLSGTYKVNSSGRFSVHGADVTTAMGCANVPNGNVLRSTGHVELSNDVLVFLSGTEKVLGRYSRVS